MASLEDVDSPKLYLFSYGSNSTQQLRAQVQNPSLLTKPAILYGYVRVFCSKSEEWGGGGVASIAPSKEKNATTHGSIAQLTPEEFDLLDSFEQGYRRFIVTVCVGKQNQEKVQAYTYVVGKKPVSPDAPFTPALKIPPTQQYIWAIHTNLREHWSIDSITVRSNDSKRGVIEIGEEDTSSDIDPTDLSLEALCVEISSYKSHPWVMQQAIDRVCHKLNEVGITDTKELILALEDPILLNNHIKAKGYSGFHFETLSIMKKLLFPNDVDSDENGGIVSNINGDNIKEDADDNNKTLVFSYGSNSTQQLRARVQNKTLMSYPATLYGYVRVFCKQSEKWGGGGVASLAPCDEPGALTRGAVVCLSNKELKLLDSFEGGYRKVDIDIVIGHVNGEKVKAIAYVAGKSTADGLFTPLIKTPPTEQYLWAIYGNLREHWSIDSIVIRSNHVEDGVIVELNSEKVSELDPTDLSLEALCVEISLNKSVPWVMPATIKPVVDKLNEIGIVDTDSLKEALKSGSDELNQQLLDNGDVPFQPETLSIMSKLLFPEQVEDDLLTEVAASPSAISTVAALTAAKEPGV